MLGWLFMGSHIMDFPRVFSIYIILFAALCLNYSDLPEFSMGKEPAIKNISDKIGEQMVRLLIGAFFFSAYIVIPYIFDNKMLYPVCLSLGAFQFYIIFSGKSSAKTTKLANLILMLILLAVLGL